MSMMNMMLKYVSVMFLILFNTGTLAAVDHPIDVSLSKSNANVNAYVPTFKNDIHDPWGRDGDVIAQPNETITWSCKNVTNCKIYILFSPPNSPCSSLAPNGSQTVICTINTPSSSNSAGYIGRYKYSVAVYDGSNYFFGDPEVIVDNGSKGDGTSSNSKKPNEKK